MNNKNQEILASITSDGYKASSVKILLEGQENFIEDTAVVVSFSGKDLKLEDCAIYGIEYIEKMFIDGIEMDVGQILETCTNEELDCLIKRRLKGILKL